MNLEQVSKYVVGMIFVTSLIVGLFCFIVLVSREIFIIKSVSYSCASPFSLTIRVNTFRRLDLLESFLEYYKFCEVVKQIQVVWSDPTNKAPTEWTKRYPMNKVIFEIHQNDSLVNRFNPILPLLTEAIFSIDDDLIIPCEQLSKALSIWNSNKRTLVGFSARMHIHEDVSGSLKYLNWQYTWWSGMYSIILTKASIFHRDYLKEFMNIIPMEMIQYINKIRNCEDIAMAFLIAMQSQSPPVWSPGVIYEVSTGGISSQKNHFKDRSECLNKLIELPLFQKEAKLKNFGWPWITGYQKTSTISFFDLLKWFNTMAMSFVFRLLSKLEPDYKSIAVSKQKLQLFTISISHFCEFARFALDVAKVKYDEFGFSPMQHVTPLISIRLNNKQSRVTKAADDVNEMKDATKKKREGVTSVPLAIDENGLLIRSSWDIASLSGLNPADEDIKQLLDEEIGPLTRQLTYGYLLKPMNRKYWYQLCTENRNWFWRLLWSLFVGNMVTNLMIKSFRTTDKFEMKKCKDNLDAAMTKLGQIITNKKSAFINGPTIGIADIALASLIGPLVMPPMYCKGQYGHIFDTAVVHDPEFKTSVEYWSGTIAGQYALKIYEEYRMN